MASTYLSQSTSAGDQKTWTFSTWFKRSNISSVQHFAENDIANYHRIRFTAGDVFEVFDSNGNHTWNWNNLFRDTSAWYHIVLRADSTQANNSDRLRLYINGELASANTVASISQNYLFTFNQSGTLNLGRRAGGEYFDGLWGHTHFIDGTSYDADTFGETDSTTGIWKPKTAPSVTYGTNGFFLKFENSGAFGTDSSGNSNTFTVNGTMTQTIDTPSNVFATFSPLVPRTSTGSAIIPNFSNGNLSASFPSSPNRNAPSTLAVSKGKYYAEFKPTNALSQNGTFYIGINCLEDYTNGFLGDQMYAYTDDGRKKTLGTYASYGNSYANNDIIGIAFDSTNGTVWFSKNGTWQNSATQTEIENGTTTNSAFSGLDTSKFWNITVNGYNETACSVNFGNGFFETTAVSSAQNPDDGIGIFEYDVPTGYRALCTKSINAEEYS